MINVLSLFDGLGGARIALDQLGIECNYYASEIDKYAMQVSAANYPDIIQLGDVTQVKANDLPRIDLLIGGSPCQDLSVAKSGRQGLEGSRSGLFYEYIRLLRELKPKYFLLENVYSMPKESQKIISKEMGCSPIMINSALLTAQNRKRFYWTNTGVFMQPMDKGIALADIIEDGEVDREKSYCIPSTIYKENEKSMLKRGKHGLLVKGCAIRPHPRTPIEGVKRVYKPEIREDDKANALLTKGGMVFLDEKQLESVSKAKGAKAHKRVKNGHEYEYSEGAVKFPQDLDDKAQTLTTQCGTHGRCTTYIKQPIKLGYLGQDKRPDSNKIVRLGQLGKGGQGDRVYSTVGKSVTLSANGGGMGAKTGLYYTAEGIRKLTPRECERLQGIPDDYTAHVSNTQRYKMIGNGFTIPVIKYILGHCDFVTQENVT